MLTIQNSISFFSVKTTNLVNSEVLLVSHMAGLFSTRFYIRNFPITVLFLVSRLPLYMVSHDEEYLSEETFEEVYVSSVTDPSLFFVQRAEQIEMNVILYY